MWMLMSIEFAISFDIGLATHSAVRWLCVGVCLEVIASLRCYLHGVLYQIRGMGGIPYGPEWCRAYPRTATLRDRYDQLPLRIE